MMKSIPFDPPHRTPRPRHGAAQFLPLLLMPLLASCTLDRHPLRPRWEPTARPTLVCPGDQVTASWDTRVRDDCIGSSCPEWPTVNVSSDPPAISASSRDSSGSTTGAVMNNTAITFEARPPSYRHMDLPTLTHNVQVALPDRETMVTRRLAGGCRGANPTWAPMVVRIGEFRSENVQLVRVCNSSRRWVRAGIAAEDAVLPPMSLLPGSCTPDLEPLLVRNAVSVGLSAAEPLPGAECGATITNPPPDLDVTVVMRCVPGLR